MKVLISNATLGVNGQTAVLGTTLVTTDAEGAVVGFPTLGLVTRIGGLRLNGFIRMAGAGENGEAALIGEGRFWPAGQVQSVPANFTLLVNANRRTIALNVSDGANELLDTGVQTIRSGAILVQDAETPTG